jgi:hypothetical protein
MIHDDGCPPKHASWSFVNDQNTLFLMAYFGISSYTRTRSHILTFKDFGTFFKKSQCCFCKENGFDCVIGTGVLSGFSNL